MSRSEAFQYVEDLYCKLRVVQQERGDMELFSILEKSEGVIDLIDPKSDDYEKQAIAVMRIAMSYWYSSVSNDFTEARNKAIEECDEKDIEVFNQALDELYDCELELQVHALERFEYYDSVTEIMLGAMDKVRAREEEGYEEPYWKQVVRRLEWER